MSDRAFERMLEQQAREKEKQQREARKQRLKKLDEAKFKLQGKRGNWQDEGQDVKSGEEVRACVLGPFTSEAATVFHVFCTCALQVWEIPN